MNKKEHTRFLKKIVVFCIGFTGAVIIACYVAAWFAVDTGIINSVMTYTCAVFGGELLLSAVLRMAEIPWRGQPKKEGEQSNG